MINVTLQAFPLFLVLDHICEQPVVKIWRDWEEGIMPECSIYAFKSLSMPAILTALLLASEYYPHFNYLLHIKQ